MYMKQELFWHPEEIQLWTWTHKNESFLFQSTFDIFWAYILKLDKGNLPGYKT